MHDASARELATLPGIGEVLTQRIVTYREEHGPFPSLDSLLLVNGIGEAKLDGIKEYIVVE